MSDPNDRDGPARAPTGYFNAIRSNTARGAPGSSNAAFGSSSHSGGGTPPYHDAVPTYNNGAYYAPAYTGGQYSEQGSYNYASQPPLGQDGQYAEPRQPPSPQHYQSQQPHHQQYHDSQTYDPYAQQSIHLNTAPITVNRLSPRLQASNMNPQQPYYQHSNSSAPQSFPQRGSSSSSSSPMSTPPIADFNPHDSTPITDSHSPSHRPPVPQSSSSSGHVRPAPSPQKTLFDQGVAMLLPSAASNPALAFTKFDQALRRAAPQSTPTYNWYSHATCLNNMAVSKRQCSRLEEALGLIQEAWKVTTRALVAEKRKLAMMGMEDIASEWMEIVVTLLALDSSAEWISHMEELEQMESTSSGSTSQSPTRHFTNNTFSGVPRDDTDISKVLHGPPIIVLFYDLTTNLGNILFQMGMYEESITQHSNCLRLAETIFEYFPLDTDFRMSFPLSIATRFGTTMASGHQQPTDGGSSSPNAIRTDPNMPSPPKNRRIHLSYLHRSTILAQSRSLTHVAVCSQALGLDDAALQCNSHALEVVAFYARTGVLGGVKEGTEVRSGYALARYGGTVLATTPTVIARNKSQKKFTREEQLRHQEGQKKKMDAFKRETMEPLQASILGNLALSYYSKGRFGSAMEQLVQSSIICRALNSALMYNRVASAIHALKVDNARLLKNLHWIRNMESQAIGASEVEECTRYWGPPRLTGINMDPSVVDPDVFAAQSIGVAWSVAGLKGLKETLLVFKEKDDLFGMLIALVNIASGYLVNGHPYVALYILGILITEQTISGYSLVAQAGEGSQVRVPEALKMHIHYTLCQTVFLLLRLQHSDSQEMFPQFLEIDHRSDTLLCCFAEPINALLEALDLQIYNFLDLEVLSVGFVTAIQGLERVREDIVSQVPYSMLYPYIGGQDAYFGATVRFINSLSNSGSGTDDGSENRGTDYVYGIGTGIDFYTQQSILIRILMGKNDWLNASGIYRNERGRSIHCYTQGAQKLDSTVTEALDILRVDTGEATSRNGLITALHESSLAALNIPPPGPDVGGTGAGANGAAPQAGVVVSRFTAAMQTSMFTAPTLFAISADIMAFGAYQMQNRGRGANAAFENDGLHDNLLAVLRIPATPSPARVHRDLLSASVAAFSGGFGMCEHCMREMLRDPDSYGELVFVGTDGSTVGISNGRGGEVVEVGSPDPMNSVFITRGAVDLKGRHMYPCKHYYQ
ncbi:hypothetical protein BC830DRAFT_1152804 [Chytriomyces sp. MP71]|nr:hypothetical protein BC830DRAFT_1152804 [Chytriomyces sp. MP71]